MSQILLFKWTRSNPKPVNSQNLLSATKVFGQFSLHGFWFFLNICWQNPAKASFMYQQWTATVHIFSKVPTSDSLVFFSEQISRTSILTQASVNTCKHNFQSFTCIGFYMFSLYNFIFQRLIWKAISVYFLWIDYWILKEWKTAKVQNHCLSILFTKMIARYLNICKLRISWLTSIDILWLWASKVTDLAGDGECKLAWFHPIWNFLANKIYHFSRLSIKQADFLPGNPAP